MGALLRGAATRAEYVLLMRNLLPAYRVLERELVAHRAVPGLAALARPQVFRSAALESDLVALAGPDFEAALPVLPVGARYASRIEETARSAPLLLAAHAYVRYLGDLNGGQVLARLLRRSIVPDPDALGFYRFPGIAGLEAFTRRYRRALDELGNGTDAGAIVEEARVAFRHNIAVSRAAVSKASVARASVARASVGPRAVADRAKRAEADPDTRPDPHRGSRGQVPVSRP